MTTNTQRILTTSDVAIKTVSIEIQVMKVDKKQMTLSVFKQLYQEPIINPKTGEILGEAWGKINYHVNCENAGAHHHVVWQKGGELRHSIVSGYRKSGTWEKLAEKACSYADAYMAARVLEGWMPENLSTWRGDYFKGLPSRYTLCVDSYDVTFYPSNALQGCWSPTQDHSYHIYGEDQIKSILSRLELPLDQETIAQKYLIPAVEEQRTLEQTWQASYDQLSQLDQLFIAV